MKILDCSFRDGGYYNNWDFDDALVQKYLYAISSANIDIIELGFRNFPKDEFFGAFAYTTDNYIETLKIDNKIIVAVMIDASSILNSHYDVDQAINILFQDKKNLELI